MTCPAGEGPSLSPVVERNRRAYDRGARAFRARTADRSLVEAQAERFAALVAPSGLVLDLGCGPGHDRPLLEARGLRVVGMDISASMLAIARTEYAGRYVCGDLLRTPFRGPVAGVWCNASLLHVPRAEFGRVVGTLAGTLAPGAPFFLSLKRGVGEGVEERRAYDGMPPRWFTYWEAEPLDAALVSAGLDVAHRGDFEGRRNPWLVRIALRYSTP